MSTLTAVQITDKNGRKTTVYKNLNRAEASATRAAGAPTPPRPASAKPRHIASFDSASLQTAYEGSYYTIVGAGDDLNKWTVGYEEQMREHRIPAPSRWISTTGAEVNDLMESDGTTLDAEDRFHDDLTFLMFPLDGMGESNLPGFKMAMGDRWFDDIVDNTRSHYDEEDFDEDGYDRDGYNPDDEDSENDE